MCLLDWPTHEPQPLHFSLYTDQASRGKKRAPLFEQDAAQQAREEMNLLYVAMTRAQQALIVSGNSKGEDKEEKKKAQSWYDRIAAAEGDSQTRYAFVSPRPQGGAPKAGNPLSTKTDAELSQGQGEGRTRKKPSFPPSSPPVNAPPAIPPSNSAVSGCTHYCNDLTQNSLARPSPHALSSGRGSSHGAGGERANSSNASPSPPKSGIPLATSQTPPHLTPTRPFLRCPAIPQRQQRNALHQRQRRTETHRPSGGIR